MKPNPPKRTEPDLDEAIRLQNAAFLILKLNGQRIETQQHIFLYDGQGISIRQMPVSFEEVRPGVGCLRHKLEMQGTKIDIPAYRLVVRDSWKHTVLDIAGNDVDEVLLGKFLRGAWEEKIKNMALDMCLDNLNHEGALT